MGTIFEKLLQELCDLTRFFITKDFLFPKLFNDGGLTTIAT
jgi:hypothetical protein